MDTLRLDPTERSSVAAWCATTLGLAHAAVSAYWLLGGTALLDTVGGQFEEWGRQRSWWALTALALVAVAKAVVAVLPLVSSGPAADRLPAWLSGDRRRRSIRGAAWAAATMLILYGGLLTAVGLLVQGGFLEAAPDADEHALAWHAFFWDPWFLLWGLALAASTWWSRPAPPREARRSA